jgi:polyisoprenoid-binding protein YceI
MKKGLAFIFTLFALVVQMAFGQNAVSHATISFKIKNLGINTSGTLGGLQTKAKFNPADLASSSLEASVEVNTLNTDNSTRDRHLREEKFFDLEHYPRITLKSVSFKHKAGNNYSGMFNLTMKGKTKLIEIPFTYAEKGSNVAFNSNFMINRLDFGVGGSSMIMSDDVYVTIDAEVVK